MDFQENTFQYNSVSINYFEKGSGKPILFLQGGGVRVFTYGVKSKNDALKLATDTIDKVVKTRGKEALDKIIKDSEERTKQALKE